MRDMEITEQEIANRKRFLEFHDEDIVRLVEVNTIAQGYAEPVIEAFYNPLREFEETQRFLRDPSILGRVKGMQREYFLRLTQGKCD